MAVSLVIWLAILLSAALTSVGVQFPGMAVSEAEAATPLACGGASCSSTMPQDYSFTPSANSWFVAGARSTSASGDPRLCLYADAGFTQNLACSQVSVANGAVEFAVRDYHHTAVATGYARTERLSGSGEVCTQVDCGGTVILAGSAPVTYTWTAGSIVRAFNLPVNAGTSYRVSVMSTTGTADLGAAIFDSQGIVGYAAGRPDAVREADRRPATPLPQGEGLVFTASQGDTFGLVVWANNAAGSGNYRVEFRVSKELEPRSVRSDPGLAQQDYFAVPEAPQGWSVIALKPSYGAVSTDADLRLYDAPDYLGQLGRSNAEAGIVDFIVANYANAPEDTAYALMISLGPLGTYKIDWEYGSEALEAGVKDTFDIATGGRVGEGRTVQLTAGEEYLFQFDPFDGTAGDVSFGLYGPRASKPNFTYGTRIDSLAGSDAFREAPNLSTGWTAGNGIETFLYTPELSGSFLLYGYQKENHDVAGELLFYPTSLIGVPPAGAPARIALAAPWPSPSHPGEAIRFRASLPASERVSLTIVDPRGRIVCRAFDGVLPAGTSTLAWDGRNAAGSPAPAGVYFARLDGPGGAGAVRRFVRLD